MLPLTLEFIQRQNDRLVIKTKVPLRLDKWRVNDRILDDDVLAHATIPFP